MRTDPLFAERRLAATKSRTDTIGGEDKGKSPSLTFKKGQPRQPEDRRHKRQKHG
jgi:hypothetical protein